MRVSEIAAPEPMVVGRKLPLSNLFSRYRHDTVKAVIAMNEGSTSKIIRVNFCYFYFRIILGISPEVSIYFLSTVYNTYFYDDAI